ncbi:hypothetical protein R52603_00168 [Paraburkholderia saeva]|uniref:Uncharacterized protein n=1 Tax=Paraburkholderia saeva TaxID=2777537 RepID=A0A9N8RU84_9BURK|nr:hypothetical protein R52603_00168 [Paraburkholderia saeva]CAG4893849.1 hypothetical protein LMG31841_01787 [Paraburkholderia saeva]CAG4907688.1 hypothetical protein R70241_03542 [Paraburkholderia saeva]
MERRHFDVTRPRSAALPAHDGDGFHLINLVVFATAAIIQPFTPSGTACDTSFS